MSIGKIEKRSLTAIAAVAALMLSSSVFAVGSAAVTTTANPAGMKVVRDAETGQLRAPTAAEAKLMLEQDMQALQAAGKTNVGIMTGDVAPQAKAMSHGGVSLELTEDTTVYSVVTRAKDGSLDMHCVTGAANAKKIVNSKNPVAKQEHKHDK